MQHGLFTGYCEVELSVTPVYLSVLAPSRKIVSIKLTVETLLFAGRYKKRSNTVTVLVKKNQLKKKTTLLILKFEIIELGRKEEHKKRKNHFSKIFEVGILSRVLGVSAHDTPPTFLSSLKAFPKCNVTVWVVTRLYL